MAIELITGRAGRAHVDSSDMRELYSNIVGRARYLLNDHGTDVAEMESANDCHLMPAELLVDGAHVRITGDGETVSIDNGSSSYDRVDVVALHYTSTGDSDSRVESISVEVVKGTPVDTGGEAQDPAMPSGSATILDGSTDVYIPYVRIKLVGLSPQDPESMLPTVPMSLYEAGTAVWPVANGGTGATTVDGAMENLAPAVSALQSKVYPTMTVTATRRGNIVTLRVYQESAAEDILTNSAWISIAQLKSGCYPTDDVIVMCGTMASNGAWLQLRVTTNGAVQIRNAFGGNNVLWSLLAATVSFACKAE